MDLRRSLTASLLVLLCAASRLEAQTTVYRSIGVNGTRPRVAARRTRAPERIRYSVTGTPATVTSGTFTPRARRAASQSRMAWGRRPSR